MKELRMTISNCGECPYCSFEDDGDLCLYRHSPVQDWLNLTKLHPLCPLPNVGEEAIQ